MFKREFLLQILYKGHVRFYMLGPPIDCKNCNKIHSRWLLYSTPWHIEFASSTNHDWCLTWAIYTKSKIVKRITKYKFGTDVELRGDAYIWRTSHLYCRLRSKLQPVWKVLHVAAKMPLIVNGCIWNVWGILD